MFGDAMYEEEDRLRRAAEGQADGAIPGEDDRQDLIAAGGLDEHLRRRQAIAQLLREVGGC
jgi:hypothetical protein